MKGRLEDGTPVLVLGRGDITGVVAGISKKISTRGNEWFYLVELDEGFFNIERTCFITLLVVHPDSLQRRD